MKLCLIKARAIYELGGYGGADGLLVREGRIARLGGYDALKRAYPEAETLDWSALYVLPALVNTHVHLEFDATAQARVSARMPRVRKARAAIAPYRPYLLRRPRRPVCRWPRAARRWTSCRKSP